VYVRGFVAAYARLLGIDPNQVAPSYVARCEEHRRDKAPRGRFLGRR
jgi:cytoskeletal protein RodZ